MMNAARRHAFCSVSGNSRVFSSSTMPFCRLHERQGRQCPEHSPSALYTKIYDQLQTSRDIFAQIRLLGEIVKKLQQQKNDALLADNITKVADDITNVMQELLVIGQKLSERAKATSDKVLDFVGAE
jgi:hypothetical protein